MLKEAPASVLFLYSWIDYQAFAIFFLNLFQPGMPIASTFELIFFLDGETLLDGTVSGSTTVLRWNRWNCSL